MADKFILDNCCLLRAPFLRCANVAERKCFFIIERSNKTLFLVHELKQGSLIVNEPKQNLLCER